MRKTVLAFLSCMFGCCCLAQGPKVLFLTSEIQKQQERIKTVVYNGQQVSGSRNQKLCTITTHIGVYDSVNALFHDPLAANYDSVRLSKYTILILLIQESARFYTKKQYDSSLRYLQLALELAVPYKFVYHELHHIRPAINNLYFLSGNMAGVMKTSAEGLVTAGKNKDKTQAAHFTNVIGHVHLKYRNFKEAKSYFETYNAQTAALADEMLMAHAQLNLAEWYIVQKDIDNSICYLNLSKNFYTQMAREGKINEATVRSRTLHINNKIAEALLLKNDCNNALMSVATDAVLDTIQNVNAYDLASYYINAGAVYNCLRQPATAIRYLLKGLHQASTEKHAEYTRDAFEQIAIAYSQMQQFDSAWKYNERYKQLRNNIEEERNGNDLFQKETVMRLELEQQKYNTALARQKILRNVLGALALLILLIALLLYNRYRLKQKNMLQQQINQQQHELLAATVSVQDQERKRIAQDLHDGLGSLLSAVKLKISDLAVPEQSSEKEKIESSIHLIDEAMQEMKNISYNMMPATLSRLGLTAALQNLFNRISTKNNLIIHYTHFGFDERLSEATELNIYRILLECINNVVKHAAATTATVQLIKHEHYINIVVEDNGKGFDVSNESVTGNGLHNIRTRVKNSNGVIDIDSRPGAGTSIIMDIVYPY